MDLMFVNGTAFIINSAREIKILAIKHVIKKVEDKLVKVEVNTTSSCEHVGEVERGIMMFN